MTRKDFILRAVLRLIGSDAVDYKDARGFPRKFGDVVTEVIEMAEDLADAVARVNGNFDQDEKDYKSS